MKRFQLLESEWEAEIQPAGRRKRKRRRGESLQSLNDAKQPWLWKVGDDCDQTEWIYKERLSSQLLYSHFTSVALEMFRGTFPIRPSVWGGIYCWPCSYLHISTTTSPRVPQTAQTQTSCSDESSDTSFIRLPFSITLCSAPYIDNRKEGGCRNLRALIWWIAKNIPASRLKLD